MESLFGTWSPFLSSTGDESFSSSAGGGVLPPLSFFGGSFLPSSPFLGGSSFFGGSFFGGSFFGTKHLTRIGIETSSAMRIFVSLVTRAALLYSEPLPHSGASPPGRTSTSYSNRFGVSS